MPTAAKNRGKKSAMASCSKNSVFLFKNSIARILPSRRWSAPSPVSRHCVRPPFAMKVSRAKLCSLALLCVCGTATVRMLQNVHGAAGFCRAVCRRRFCCRSVGVVPSVPALQQHDCPCPRRPACAVQLQIRALTLETKPHFPHTSCSHHKMSPCCRRQLQSRSRRTRLSRPGLQPRAVLCLHSAAPPRGRFRSSP